MLDIKLLQLSIKDYFTKDMLKLIIYPLLGSLIVMFILFFTIADMGLSSLEETQIEIQTHQTLIENGQINEETTTQTYTGNSILDFLLRYTITSWIVSFLVYTIGLFAVGYLSIFISLIIVGFLTPKILSIIHKRHYKELKLEYGYDTILNTIFTLFKTTLIMILLFIVLIPLYFIPIVNIFAINLPFYYFFHKILNYDVSANLMTKNKFQQLYYFNRTSIRAKTIFLYTISLIPFVAFFIAIFYIIFIGHSYFKLLENDTNGD
ncbi:MAG: EI24 domain-containing protein [Campylobacterota bacterium]|nr:EI24 domain-containing protein [Campylobacterota bacterium]